MSTPDYRIIFDGGSRGNSGPGYGSYLLSGRSMPDKPVRLSYSGTVTSNEAEYDTLIAALRGLLDLLASVGHDPRQTTVEVRGDSRLVIAQVTGEWQAREPRMRERRDEVLALAEKFKRVVFKQETRQAIVRLLGH